MAKPLSGKPRIVDQPQQAMEDSGGIGSKRRTLLFGICLSRFVPFHRHPWDVPFSLLNARVLFSAALSVKGTCMTSQAMGSKNQIDFPIAR
jgi:hypothetical protein